MRQQAIILKKIPIREYDELVICYTPNLGKQTFQAKSIRRSISKQASHLDILNLVDFSLVTGNGHPIITSAYALKTYPTLKTSLPSLVASFFLLECFDKLVFDGEPDPELWNFLLIQLEQFNQLAPVSTTNWIDQIKRSHQALINILGYDPGASVETIAGLRFNSLQLARKMLR